MVEFGGRLLDWSRDSWPVALSLDAALGKEDAGKLTILCSSILKRTPPNINHAQYCGGGYFLRSTQLGRFANCLRM